MFSSINGDNLCYSKPKILIAGVSALVLLSSQVQAITPSPQMIEQFMTLPKAEQERLAQQYGIDPSMLSGRMVHQIS